LPFVNARLGERVGLTQWASEAAGHYKIISEGLSIGLLSVGYGASAAVSGLSAIGTVSVGLGQTLKFVREFGVATKLAALGTYAWTTAQWALDVAMDSMGIGEILAIAALAAAYEIYEHWGAIADFFTGLWNRIASIDWRGLGESILKNIGEGLLNVTGLSAVGSAAEKVAGLIGGYFIHHSPPAYGPLRELSHLRIVETIAEHIRPGPVIAAAGRTAAAIAIAAPMMVASAAPAFAGSSASAARTAIVINAPVTVTVGAGADKDAIEKIVVRAFTQHRYELVRAMEGELARRERTKLS
jgi:hypothetical protein